jgi:hypothetical protein
LTLVRRVDLGSGGWVSSCGEVFHCLFQRNT